MVSGIIGNDVPRKGLRVRSPCPPLRPPSVGRFRLGMCRLLTETESSTTDPYLERPPKRRLISPVGFVKQSAAGLSTRRSTNKALDRSARSSVSDLC